MTAAATNRAATKLSLSPLVFFSWRVREEEREPRERERGEILVYGLKAL